MTDTPTEGRDVLVEALREAQPAIDNLRQCQRQLDMDGCEVGVSRQALDETLAAIDKALSAAVLTEPKSMPDEEWRSFLKKAYAARPRITNGTVTIGKDVVTVDWSKEHITANGKRAGEPMSWAENDAWSVVHNQSVTTPAPERERATPLDPSGDGSFRGHDGAK